MKKTSMFRPVSVLFFAVILLSGCSALKQGLTALSVDEPEARVSNVRLESATLTQANLVFEVEIDNPNKFDIRSSGFDLSMQVQGAELFQIDRMSRKITLPAHGSAVTEVPVSLKYADLYRLVSTLKGRESFDYTIDAGFYFSLPVLGDVRTPVEYSANLPIPQLPVIKITGTSLEKMDWNGADLNILLDITNPNTFGFDVTKLRYRLLSGNKEMGNGEISSVKIARQETTSVNIPVRLNFARLGEQAYQLFAGQKLVDLGLKGELRFAPEWSAWKPSPVSFNLGGQLKP